MSELELRALAALRLHWAPVPEDVWIDSPFHVDGLHRSAERTVLAGLEDAADSAGPSPIGVALIGQGGAGKTHFLGWTRQQVQNRGGYFFLVELVDPTRFWDSAMVSIMEGLAVRPATGGTQLRVLLQRLMFNARMPAELFGEILGRAPLTKTALDAFVDGLRSFDDLLVRRCQDTLRALVLYGSTDPAAQDIAQTFLTSCEEQEPGERSAWRIRREARPAQRLVQDISRLLAATGPTVMAVDQIDPILAQIATLEKGDVPDEWRHLLQLDDLAAGLMQLREQTRRTLTVIACLDETWELIRRKAIGTVQDRFREASQLQAIPDDQTARDLVAKRFAPQFAQAGFTPPYDTWPVHPTAFAQATTYTPRRLLIRIDAHVRRCIDAEEVVELRALNESIGPGPKTRDPKVDFAAIDELFEQMKKDARTEVEAALDPVSEDDYMPLLLSAGLRAWTVEKSLTSRCDLDAPTKGRPLLHARLRIRVADDNENEEHWAFRAISATQWKAVRVRIENARTKAGHDGSPGRALFLLRNDDTWPDTPTVRKALADYEAAGGRRLRVSQNDLVVLAALRALFDKNPDQLESWLKDRSPASATTLLREALGDATGAGGQRRGPSPDDGPSSAALQIPQPSAEAADTSVSRTGRRSRPEAEIRGSGPPAITVGVAQEPVRIELAALRKHTAIFAGSGSGKTVLIRRIVEECALHGVSAIVLDPNNDLARLGDPWPQPPTAWGPDDPEKAARYLADTDVVVWTPRWASGRPLTFQPLPDFADVVSDVDEFNQAVEVAVTSLVPRAKIDGRTTKAAHSRAVLTEALRSFAHHGMSGLDRFVEFLAALPDGTSRMTNAGKLAGEMAETLTAAMVNDPLFGGSGIPVDPGALLTPVEGKRARISVISLIGLPADSQRQSFVNQLQMALFAWIKRHPAGDRPLGGLFVMDEAQTFAPSGAMTACTASTIALAAQARKYGLGLVFATQAPRGLHNRIPGNASTQFFGLLNSPTQITAAREMAQAKGGDIAEISRLQTGQFYVALEGSPFVKARAPLCLSHHPQSPLTTEEVVSRARTGLASGT
jgi:hypothetical protein